MLKPILKLKYRVHLFLQKYNEVLMEDALCKKLKAQLQQKAAYHGQQVHSLYSKI